MARYEKNVYRNERIYKHSSFFYIILLFPVFVKKRKATAYGRRPKGLLLAERLAVGALIHGGIQLMGAHQDPIQGTVVFGIAVIGTLLNGAFDALVCLAAHGVFLLLFGFTDSMPRGKEEIRKNFSFSCNYAAAVI